ncbi:MAG: ankyrin repeat domain-containing protein [Alphaproteobacteria bacterium]
MSLSDFFNSDKRTARKWAAIDKENGRPTSKEANARLLHAYKCGGLEMAEQALKAGACVDLLVDGRRIDGVYSGYTQHQFTLLTKCAKEGLNGLAEILLRYGARTDQNDTEHRYPPLHWAADAGNTKLVRMLLDAGANPEYYTHGLTARDLADRKQYTDISRMIYEEPARREAQMQAAVAEAIRAKAAAEQALRDAEAALQDKAPSVTETGQSITIREPLKIKKPSRGLFS